MMMLMIKGRKVGGRDEKMRWEVGRLRLLKLFDEVVYQNGLVVVCAIVWVLVGQVLIGPQIEPSTRLTMRIRSSLEYWDRR
jgi:hypothetical protein